MIVHYAPYPRGKSRYYAKCGQEFTMYAKEGCVSTPDPIGITCKKCQEHPDVYEQTIQEQHETTKDPHV